jgi:hypothetical protein
MKQESARRLEWIENDIGILIAESAIHSYGAPFIYTITPHEDTGTCTLGGDDKVIPNDIGCDSIEDAKRIAEGMEKQHLREAGILPAEPEEQADETPDAVRAERDTLRKWEAEIHAQADRVAEATIDHEEKKLTASSAKKQLDLELEELARLAGMRCGPGPLFNGAQTDANGELFPNDQPPDEPWREATLDELGITGALAEKLIDAEIETLGDIADWTNSGHTLTDIPGVGEAKADVIQAACEKYSYRWPTVTK